MKMQKIKIHYLRLFIVGIISLIAPYLFCCHALAGPAAQPFHAGKTGSLEFSLDYHRDLSSNLKVNIGEIIFITEHGISDTWTNLNLQSAGGRLQWQAGRSPLKLGVGHYDSLVLNREISGFDLLRYDCNICGIDYTKFVLFLDPSVNRFLFGHRLKKSFMDGRLELGAHEVLLAAGDYNGWFYNPLPFVPYYFLQHVFLKAHELDNSNINMDSIRVKCTEKFLLMT